MFTHGVVSAGTSDLIQQAFQQMTEEDNSENDFVAFLHSDGNETQAIHLTSAQAAALGLNFEVDDTSDVTSCQQNSNLHEGGDGGDQVIQNDSTLSEVSSSALHTKVTIECMGFESNMEEMVKDADVKTEKGSTSTDVCVKKSNDAHLVQQTPPNHETDSYNASLQGNVKLQKNIHINCQEFEENKNANLIGLHYNVNEKNVHSGKAGSIESVQAQIFQKLPVILPSSQFIVRPSHSIVKPAKNVHIIPCINKMSNTVVNRVLGVNPVDGYTQNSILLPKTTLRGPVSPQVTKVVPVSKFSNNSKVPVHMLNASQIKTGQIQVVRQMANDSQMSNPVMKVTSPSSQNILRPQLRLPSASKTSQATIQKENVQKIFNPLVKSNSNSLLIKGTQVLNNTNLTAAISTSFLKSLQIPAQMLKMPSTAVVKHGSVAPSLEKTTVDCAAPITLQVTPIVKSQDLRTIPPCPIPVLKPSNVGATRLSILKPQTKVTQGDPCKSGIITSINNSENVSNNVHVTTAIQSKTPHRPSNNTESVKPLENSGIRQKVFCEFTDTNIKSEQKVRTITGKKSATVAIKQNVSKPLGSSENPIQIVQQGRTFHSMQHLSQSQLKQIAQVLQRRGHETSVSNEKIVYRVVFPEELDLRFRNPETLLKSKGSKRGRPKKNAVRPLIPSKPLTSLDDEQDEPKDERKKVIARTRSGRLSRPPRHMLRDYKHLHHLDFLQPDLDDSDGGYSDYNTNGDKLDDEESPKGLLSGLEVPKRKISDHFRCPTCNKIYLGRTRMARHFELHPDHGSLEQLPAPTAEPEVKQTFAQDPLKRKGKKRGPWAYVTPEAKSERRQTKLKEAISVCENVEIAKIAAKPVLGAQSLFELLVLKSESNVRTFLDELKELMHSVRKKAGVMLTLATDGERTNEDVIDLSEELLCDALGLNPGLYTINCAALRKSEPSLNGSLSEEPPQKMQRVLLPDKHAEEKFFNGFSENSDLGVADFLGERKPDAPTNCPEVLTALTLMPKCSYQENGAAIGKSGSVSKLLISNPEIQNQISENPGFQKVDISTTSLSSFQKLEPFKKNVAKLDDNPENLDCSEAFPKLRSNFETSKLDQPFIKLEPIEGFAKLENSGASAYRKGNSHSFDKFENGYDISGNQSRSFDKGFQKASPKVVSIGAADLHYVGEQNATSDDGNLKISSTMVACKISDGIPILQDAVPIMSSTCDSNIFGSTENLDMSKITNYDHIAHMDILSTNGVIDKNLMIDEKLVEQLHLVEQSNLVDELVSERLKNMMPDGILEGNLIPNHSNLDTDLDFEALSEEFNRNTRN
ncbi:uncharacterized protein LOC105697810 [Orussus abietinus]|uniref:uncharacterized protein LOC105697810 n=1 Tax=Orussus abietinus TaxID=222816 RepID=UPI000626B3DD|nr:uncharacterized protein LOC105697810 [Orussus abietinus]XP_012276901.1 uncharacterized protein LOC105697810 [Orussus abietinus]XP_012276902.1 uncharacterized protein LOC105697810 [Orussus abietinus]